ncbi:hypothetical protein MNBD_ACTINO02-2919 [hydrothermal vent metagenome]|uniref:Exo-alpha-sialidase n=1 Tax=hydrothermal vent metagenome TaxID=652676 RepID=A0A3B0SKI9_9ZZZZ
MPILLLTIVAAACGSTPGSDTTTAPSAPATTTAAPPSTAVSSTTVVATTTTTLPPGVLGEDWEVVDSDLNPRAAAVHGDTLFVISDDDAGIRVLSSRDGEEWTQEADLNTLSAGAITDVQYAGLVSDGSDLYGYVTTNASDGVSANGANLDLYIIDNKDGTWNVRGPETTGLDQRLEGDESFRFWEGGGHGIVARDGQVAIALTGQWWIPYETSSFDFSIVSNIEGNTWSTYAENRNRVDPSLGWFMIDGFARSDEGLIIAISDKVSDGPLQERLTDAARLSTDGVTWEPGFVPASEGISKVDFRGLVFGGGQFVAVGVQAPPTNATEDEVLTSWVSTDGLSWTLGELLMPTETSPNGVDLKRVVWTGATYVVLASDDQTRAWTWISADGINWDLTPVLPGVRGDDSSYPINGTRQLLAWNGGVVAFSPDFTSFSPPRR